MGLPNTYPFEVMGAPHSLYIATYNTARPALTVADPVGAGWTLVGLNGNRSYAEEGVSVNSPQAFNYFRGYGTAATLKAFRTEEDVQVGVTVADMTLESLILAFNKLAAGVSEVGVTKSFGFSRGLSVQTMALLVRGPSPYMDDGFAQFWLPVAANITSAALGLRRDNGTTYTLEFRALWSQVAEAATAGEGLGAMDAQEGTT